MHDEPSLPSTPNHVDPALFAPLAEPVVPATALLRVTRSVRQLDSWTLALTSRGVSPLVRWLDDGIELHVLHQDVAFARAELDAIDVEDRDAQQAARADAAVPRRQLSRHAPWGALLMAVLLVGFFAVTGPRAAGAEWFSAGAADAERVLHGEWWRAVTALTLHADSAHVLSNVAFGSVVVGAVMRSEGIGWGSALVLASGTAGNFINAWAHQTHHHSVGFSTAVFGAIGLLGGLSYVHARRRSSSARSAWTAIAGAMALLALLGMSEKAGVDVAAHLFGSLAGVALGLLVAWTGLRPASARGQWLAGAGTASAVVAAWAVALQ